MFISRDKKGLALLDSQKDIHLSSFSPLIGKDGHVTSHGTAYLECQGDRGWLLTTDDSGSPSDSKRLLGSLKGYLHIISTTLPEEVPAQETTPVTTTQNIFS